MHLVRVLHTKVLGRFKSLLASRNLVHFLTHLSRISNFDWSPLLQVLIICLASEGNLNDFHVITSVYYELLLYKYRLLSV